MIRALLIAIVLAAFVGSSIAQDATGLGGLPKGKAVGSTRMLSVSPSEVWGTKMVPAGVLTGSSQAQPSDPALEMLWHEEPAHSPGSAKCENSSRDLCYDAADRHIVYRPARQLMPTIRGLTAENIYVRRDGVKLKYSFP